MDVRRNFSKMGRTDRQRFIEAIKWMKDNDRSGVNGATVTPSSDGGVYQRYVLFHARGQITANLSDFAIALIPAPADTLHSIVVDNEEWVSTAKHPVTEAGLRAFLNDIPLSGGGQATGGPFNQMVADPAFPLPILGGHINNSPFADIKIRLMPSGSTAPSEFAFTGTVKPGLQYRLNTYQMAHRSPAFLPWHRVFLRLFEKDLQFADKQRGKDGKITLPYWNWMRDTDWDESSKSSVWHKENFGGFTDTATGAITGDHFSPSSTWKLFDGTRTLLTGVDGELARRRTSERPAPPSSTLPLPAGVFPTVTAADSVVNNALYIDETTIGTGHGGGGGGLGGNRQFAGGLEHMLHDPVHGVVGGAGQMSNALFSPQDPIFWLFHCYIDRIWSRWQWRFARSRQYPRFGMLPGRRLNDPMEPWAVAGLAVPPYEFNVRVKDVLNAANFGSAVNSNELLGKGYKYDSLKL
jgi:tyrosinase